MAGESSSRTRLDAVVAFMAWKHALAPGAAVVFHDYGPTFPGVAQAISDLRLHGEAAGRSLFIWRSPDTSASASRVDSVSS